MPFQIMESGGALVSGNAPLAWKDFMDRMRHPSAADFVKSIRRYSFSFSFAFAVVVVIFNVGRLSCLLRKIYLCLLCYCSFFVSFTNKIPNPQSDSADVQQFFADMDKSFRSHSLWASCSDEELDSAGEVCN